MSDYDDGFDAGILHQCMQERDEDARRELKQRAAAFGAIRRAAEQARCYDAAMHPSPEAFAIRYAIRAAVGSEQAS